MSMDDETKRMLAEIAYANKTIAAQLEIIARLMRMKLARKMDLTTDEEFSLLHIEETIDDDWSGYHWISDAKFPRHVDGEEPKP